MVNRNGFIRIAELLVAITLISIMLILFYRQTELKQETQDLGEVSRDVLAEISSTEILRNEVVLQQANTAGMTQTVLFINDTLPDYINFELRACDISSACGQLAYRGNVYSAERIISTNQNSFDPIKLRLFLWVNE